MGRWGIGINQGLQEMIFLKRTVIDVAGCKVTTPAGTQLQIRLTARRELFKPLMETQISLPLL